MRCINQFDCIKEGWNELFRRLKQSDLYALEIMTEVFLHIILELILYNGIANKKASLVSEGG